MRKTIINNIGALAIAALPAATIPQPAYAQDEAEGVRKCRIVVGEYVGYAADNEHKLMNPTDIGGGKIGIVVHFGSYIKSQSVDTRRYNQSEWFFQCIQNGVESDTKGQYSLERTMIYHIPFYSLVRKSSK